MQKIWLKNYPPGVPAEIDPNAIRSLREMVEKSCAAYADRSAYVQMNHSLGYRELDELSRRFGAWLQHSAGLKRGDRLAIMLPNVLQYPIAMFGALRAGLTIVNTNPLYTPRELEHQLNDSGAEAIVVLENFAHVVQEVLPRTRIRRVLVTAVGDMLGFPTSWIVNFVVRHGRKQVPPWRIEGALDFKSELNSAESLQLNPVELGHEDIAFLQYTGGTTGVAKGAVLTHGNICANVLQAEAWISSGLAASADHTRILVTPIPLYHIFALTANCMVFLRLGWQNVLITNPRDFPRFVAELKKHPFAYISGVNTLFNALLHTPGFERVDFSHLKITLGGGMAVQAAVAERWKSVTGNPITQAWGLTERRPGCASIPRVRTSTGRSAFPYRRLKSPSKMMPELNSRSTRSGKSVSAARR